MIPYDVTITSQVNGNDVILTCTAEGGPSNAFEWTRSNNNSQVLSTSSMLTLDRTDPTTYDTYTCTVQNPAGSGSTMITLEGEKSLIMTVNMINSIAS